MKTTIKEKLVGMDLIANNAESRKAFMSNLKKLAAYGHEIEKLDHELNTKTDDHGYTIEWYYKNASRKTIDEKLIEFGFDKLSKMENTFWNAMKVIFIKNIVK
jgi:hypothetical protein